MGYWPGISSATTTSYLAARVIFHFYCHQNHLFLLVATVQVLLTTQYHGIIRAFRNNDVLVMFTLPTSYKEEMKNMGESSL